jgi:hypothetical protein
MIESIPKITNQTSCPNNQLNTKSKVHGAGSELSWHSAYRKAEAFDEAVEQWARSVSTSVR